MARRRQRERPERRQQWHNDERGFIEPGKIGQAFSFDGTNQYVEIPDSPGLSPAGSFSIVAWINPLPGDGPRIILAKWGDTDDYDNHRSYVFCLEHDNVLRFGIADAAHQWDTAFHEFDSQATVTPDTWSHVAAVYDHDTGARRIYRRNWSQDALIPRSRY